MVPKSQGQPPGMVLKTIWNSGITLPTLNWLQGLTTIPGGCLGFLNHQQYHLTAIFSAQISFSSLMGEAPSTNMVFWDSNGLVRLNDSNTFFCWFYFFLQLLFGYKKNIQRNFFFKKVYVYTIYIAANIYIYMNIYWYNLHKKSVLKTPLQRHPNRPQRDCPRSPPLTQGVWGFSVMGKLESTKKSKNPRFFPKKST